MSYLWANGEPISIQVNALGLPTSFQWQDRVHGVQSIANRWRIDEGWWQERIWRDYYKLITDSGLLVIIYQDLVSKQWRLQRVYD